MNQFKRAKVIMLPTDKLTNIVLNPTTNNLSIPKELIIGTDNLKRFIEVGFIPQHLYIISDDEIKEGDWCFNPQNATKIFQVTDLKWINNMTLRFNNVIKKIIATTDISLDSIRRTNTWGTPRFHPLPQPSQQFIEKYIESYNKGEVITDVLVEYENYFREAITGIPPRKSRISFPNEFRLKINPKDNTITIKKLKDSWNREEVVELLHKLNIDTYKYLGYDNLRKIHLTKWIEENL